MKLTALTQPLYDHLYHDILQFRSTFDLPSEDESTLDDKADTLHTSLVRGLAPVSSAWQS